MKKDIRCELCGRKPDEISEYVEAASEEKITPDQYILENEGTYNPINGHFYCTNCYIEIGMPLGMAK